MNPFLIFACLRTAFLGAKLAVSDEHADTRAEIRGDLKQSIQSFKDGYNQRPEVFAEKRRIASAKRGRVMGLLTIGTLLVLLAMGISITIGIHNR